MCVYASGSNAYLKNELIMLKHLKTELANKKCGKMFYGLKVIVWVRVKDTFL